MFELVQRGLQQVCVTSDYLLNKPVNNNLKFCKVIYPSPQLPPPLFSFSCDPQMNESQRSPLLCFALGNESHICRRGQALACWWLGYLRSLTGRSRVAVKGAERLCLWGKRPHDKTASGRWRRDEDVPLFAVMVPSQTCRSPVQPR